MPSGLIKITATVAVAAALLAGCSTKEGGTATPGTTTGVGPGGTGGSTPSAPSGTNNAPKISVPLDASRYLSQPCAVLSPAQLQAFKISSPGISHTDDQVAQYAGPFCGWTTDEIAPRGFEVGFLTSNKHGLADIIRGGKSAFPGYFEPTEVDGYPAVYNDLVDGRSRGICNITVGISETLAFRTAEQADHERGVKACDGAKQFAVAVIKSLKGA